MYNKTNIGIVKQFPRSTFVFIRHASLASLLVSPIIYSLIIPFLLIDFWIFCYQCICFPIYKIDKVKRSDYIFFDRGNLEYLNLIERLNCNYCGYTNGLVAYIKEVAARSEQYFCPIKHQKSSIQELDPHYSHFLTFGDSHCYQEKLDKFREQLSTKDTLK